MQKKSIFIVLLIVLLMICFGKGISSAFFDRSSGTEEIVAQFGHGPYNIDSELLEFEDEVKFDYLFRNEAGECSVGIVLFVNGVSQPYCIDQDEEQKYIHVINLEAEKDKIVNIKFVPSVGKRNDTLPVRIGVILNPNCKLSAKDKFQLGNNLQMSQVDPLYIHYKTDGSNKMDGKKSELVNISNVEVVQNELETLQDEQFTYENTELKNIIRKQGPTNLNLLLDSEIKNTYRISFFYDYEPIKIEDNGQFYIDVDKERLEEVSVNLNLNWNAKAHARLKTFYAIAIPIDNSEEGAYMLKSDSLIVK